MCLCLLWPGIWEPLLYSVGALVALTLAVAMFVLPLGRAADLLGHVVVFRMGLLLAVAGFALASL